LDGRKISQALIQLNFGQTLLPQQLAAFLIWEKGSSVLGKSPFRSQKVQVNSSLLGILV
jgi:hypothetical protein